ncbi:MAG: radical SAM protein [Muribaculaceae bacterium]|nr:radical SAM protein [Muribaculaceae bacterium]
MKSSNYNYFVENGDKTIIFNGISEKFIEIDNRNLLVYKHVISNPDIYMPKLSSLLNKLSNGGFIIDENVDENYEIEQKFQMYQKNDQYFLMILPTYQCNLRCWYCIQDHKDLWMSDETSNRIKLRISKKIQDPEIKTLHISWFGGEPLMNYPRIVELTKYAQTESIKYGKHFSCNITTNGTLLTPEKIQELFECGVNDYQITIDGTKKVHDSIKQLSNESAFEKTIANVNEIIKHTHCSLRFNYTQDNLMPNEIINEINERITPDNRNNISLLLYKVWQENENNIDSKDIELMYNKGNEVGISCKLPRAGMCYADQKHFDCIFPDGSSEKCDNDSPITAKGKLTSDGEIVWAGSEPECHISPYLIKDSECRHCKFLPICWGPCVAKRKIMLEKKGKIICQHSNKLSYMHNIIHNIVKNVHSDRISNLK